MKEIGIFSYADCFALVLAKNSFQINQWNYFNQKLSSKKSLLQSFWKILVQKISTIKISFLICWIRIYLEHFLIRPALIPRRSENSRIQLFQIVFRWETKIPWSITSRIPSSMRYLEIEWVENDLTPNSVRPRSNNLITGLLEEAKRTLLPISAHTIVLKRSILAQIFGSFNQTFPRGDVRKPTGYVMCN